MVTSEPPLTLARAKQSTETSNTDYVQGATTSSKRSSSMVGVSVVQTFNSKVGPISYRSLENGQNLSVSYRRLITKSTRLAMGS